MASSLMDSNSSASRTWPMLKSDAAGQTFRFEGRKGGTDMLGANAMGFRLLIGNFEGRDFGKSSFRNATPNQKVSIVSETVGTGSDPAGRPIDDADAWGPRQEQQLAELRSYRIPALVTRERANL
jgi:hypothetical protein